MNARSLAITRAVAVIGGTGALIVGATFAAVTNVGMVSLTGNTFAATQGIQISNGGVYGDTASGFNFGNAPVGKEGSPKQNFYLEDVTNSTTGVALSVAGANCGTFAGLIQSKVHVNIEKNGGTVVDSPTIAKLCGATNNSVNLDPTNSPAIGGAGTKYDVWITLDPGAVTPGSLNPASNGFDLNFTGTES
jgi:hypothetical protein